MARLNSFFLPSPAWPSSVGESTLLDGPEARHMLKVLRTRAGDVVRLFDGCGREGLFRVAQTSRNKAELEAVKLDFHQPPAASVTVACGWNKSSRRGFLFEKAVELRAGGVAFWQSARSQGGMPDCPKDVWTEKCVQAAKQCGNPCLPELHTVAGGVPGLLEFGERFDRKFVAWEGAEREFPLSPAHLEDGSSLVVIGPEGGFDDDEAEALMDGGFAPVTLGDSILRWETAALYCLGLGFFARQVEK